uniref:Annexin 10 n=1 Tax=Spironucleus vortens TaxID=58336 RepID=A0A142C678_SPIVO|nr:annexin 10 [Spironucleus vortens]
MTAEQGAIELYKHIEAKKSIIDIAATISRIPPNARSAVAGQYQKLYKDDLHKTLVKHLSGDCEDLLTGMMQDRMEFWAAALREAIKGANDNDKVVDVLFSLLRSEYWQVLAAYERLYGRDLRADLLAEYRGARKDKAYAELLCQWLDAENTKFEDPCAYADELAMHFGQLKNSALLIKLLTVYSPEFIQQVSAAYRVKFNRTIADDIKKNFKKIDEEAFLYVYELKMNSLAAVKAKILSEMKDRDAIIYFTVLYKDFFDKDTAFKAQVAKECQVKFNGNTGKALAAVWSV